MKEEINKEKVTIAALLHDIGKFWQRSDDLMKDSLVVKEWYDASEWLTPLSQNSTPGYQHAFWTYAFLKKHNAMLSKFGLDGDEFRLLSASHHRPETMAESIISLADKWSSSNERGFTHVVPMVEEDYQIGDYGHFSYKKVPLHNIFDIVKRKDDFRLDTSEQSVFNLRPLSVIGEDVSIFPQSAESFGVKSLQDQYKVLWEAFDREFALIGDKCNSMQQFIVSLMALLKKYTWCIPSSTMDMPYSSLYEHSKITAAIAVSLYDYYREDPEYFSVKKVGNYGNQLAIKTDKDPLQLLCVDLSGIQNYIYDIAGSRAAKALKGRSFNLQLLMNSILNQILYHPSINLEKCNEVYASGGKAYLLLPKLEKVDAALKEIQINLEKKFFSAYQTSLYPAIDSVSFRYNVEYREDENFGYKLKMYSSDELLVQNLEKENRDYAELGDLWRISSDKASAKKLQKYKHLLMEEDSPIYQVDESKANWKKCVVTGIRMPKEAMKSLSSDGVSEESNYVIPEVYQQIQLGAQLKKAEYASVGYDLDTSNREIYLPARLPTSYFLNQNELTNFPGILLYAFNSTDLDNVHSFLFYGGNEQPEIGDQIASFEEICKSDDGESTKLGVLKMDVDSLGAIFIQGFPESDKSFSAYATLSFYLEAFFSGYINEVRGQDEFKKHIQIIYSGGDDVFAVGRWDKIIDFADQLNRDFHKLTRRDDITLSAGIAIVRPKYPIVRAAKLADEAEKKSKNYPESDKVKTKNAITFFNDTVSWVEFEFVKEQKNMLLDFIVNDNLSRGFLHRLQLYKTQKDEAIKIKQSSRRFSYKWHAAYTIGRMKTGKDKDIELDTYLDQIAKNLMHNETMSPDRYLDLLALAARWAEYLLKDKTSNEDT